MNARLSLALAASLAIATAAGWYIFRTVAIPGPATSAPRPASAPAVQTIGAERVLTIGLDAQRASGIEVAPVTTTRVRTQYDAYATVVDPQPLFDLSTRLAAAQADVATVAEQAGNSKAQYQRSRQLFDDDHNVSLKALQDSHALMQADRDKLQSARAALAGLSATARAQFGEVLAHAVASPGSGWLARLQSGSTSLLRVTLPSTIGSGAPERVTLHAPDGESITAHRLSPSPVADPAVQGDPWFYAAPRALPAGMHTLAVAATPQKSAPAWLIPADAIVWYGGQTWAYVRTAPDRFARRLVQSASEDDAGVEVTTGFRAGDSIVTRGAQLLLSEELKPEGVATACKDPPECDD
ncbi:metal transporter [Trinickia sp. Y13]|uniref:efflux RND transporter periplasmic adaptor subunit n=1 Tax=Trinickia sp. Y13 TaxID=2917807 RepID=UPI0024053802|nr:metal transporter [Trinickia sp. Y13]MDG0027555.1 metal transporter [Trinickia sp. Y13]